MADSASVAVSSVRRVQQAVSRSALTAPAIPPHSADREQDAEPDRRQPEHLEAVEHEHGEPGCVGGAEHGGGRRDRCELTMAAHEGEAFQQLPADALALVAIDGRGTERAGQPQHKHHRDHQPTGAAGEGQRGGDPEQQRAEGRADERVTDNLGGDESAVRSFQLRGPPRRPTADH